MSLDLEKLKAEITCFLCQDILSDPKNLPCQHVYCSKCLEVTASGTLACPQCNEEVRIIGGNIASLPTAHAKKRRVVIYNNAVSLGSIPCAPQPKRMCEIHSTEALNMYCDTCGQLMCRDCVLLYCAKERHDYRSAEGMIKKFLEEMNHDLESFPTLHNETSAILSKLSASGTSLKVAHKERLQKLDSTFVLLANVLEQERSCCEEAIRKTFEEDERQNSYAAKKVDEVVKGLHSLLQSIPSCQRNPSIEQLVDYRKKTREVRATLTSILHEQVDLPDIEVDLCSPSQLKAFLGETVGVRKHSLECYVEDFNFEVNMSSEIVVHLCLSNVEGHLGSPNLYAELLCTYDLDSAEIATVNRINSDTYLLSLTPQKRGKHELVIQCNGEPICGSPKPVFVTMAPHKLTKATPAVQELKGIVAIKFFGGKLYVTEDDIALVIMDLLATRVESRFEVRNILEIAIGASFYYATVKRNTVIKMDTKGNILKSIGKRGSLPGEFNIVNGIALKDGELYVCDTGNDRVQVFDEDLNFIRSMGTYGPGRNYLSKPDNIVFDEEGNLYVVEEGNHRVQVLTPMCRHVRYIGAPGSRAGELKKPVAAAIFRDLIYIIEFGNKRVSVFTKTGEFVSTFADGLFSEPDNIVVDENGYIYVTDLKSKLFIF